MLFNSYLFWAFFAVVLLLYRGLKHRGQNRMLLVASYVFYGSWDWRFLSLIVFSTLVDYWVGLALADPSATDRRRRRLVTVSLVSNLGLLAVFKYLGFFVDSAAALLEGLGLQANLPSLHIILPVGISFYTFQTLSYTIDIYRRKLEPTRDLLDFGLYVAFFPQLVAGPIERASHLLPQVLRPRRTTERQFREGLYCILYGLFKKVVIADNMALVVNHIFSQPPSTLNGLDTLVGVYAFAFQIYGDFHGYSLIAQGVARWLGFDIMDNFRQPYFAWSPQEFWRRWHISLSTWLRDYLYIPLGGSRGTAFQTYRNLAATMVLGGLWHGAAWTFVVWGTVHGVWLGIHRAIKRDDAGPGGWLARGMKIFVTFQIVCVTWLFFRAESVGQAFTFLGALGTEYAWTPAAQLGAGLLVVFAVPMVLYEAWVDRSGDLFAMTRVARPVRAFFYLALVMALVWFYAPAPSEFIYFQF
ncbi:MAG: MBOAT family protein [Gemmatimonadetes bacterium]|nr:MBOAT family protein [Gemmatimonadota bacterium]